MGLLERTKLREGMSLKGILDVGPFSLCFPVAREQMFSSIYTCLDGNVTHAQGNKDKLPWVRIPETTSENTPFFVTSCSWRAFATMTETEQ